MNTTDAKSKSLIRFPERLLEIHPCRRQWIYSDNPPVHRSKVLKEWSAGHPRVVLRPLPRYSPDINQQEQWWNYERAKLLNNRYFPTNRRPGGEECLQPLGHIRTAQIAALLSRNAMNAPEKFVLQIRGETCKLMKLLHIYSGIPIDEVLKSCRTEMSLMIKDSCIQDSGNRCNVHSLSY